MCFLNRGRESSGPIRIGFGIRVPRTFEEGAGRLIGWYLGVWQDAKHLGKTRLRVEVHRQNPVTVQAQILRQVRGSGGLGDTTLEIADGHDQRALAGSAARRDAEGALQLVDLLQGEFTPSRADLCTLRKELILL